MSETWINLDQKKEKNRFHRGKQKYKCKNCDCNYTEGKKGYLGHVKQKEIKYHLEGLKD